MLFEVKLENYALMVVLLLPLLLLLLYYDLQERDDAGNHLMMKPAKRTKLTDDSDRKSSSFCLCLDEQEGCYLANGAEISGGAFSSSSFMNTI